MQETGTFKAEKAMLVDPDKLDGERKDEFLKRRAKEDREAKKGNKVVAEWFCLSKCGRKLLKRIKKANGGEYTTFMFNIKKNKKMYEEVYKAKVKPYDFEPEKKTKKME